MGAQGSLSASAHIHDSMRKCGVKWGPRMEKGMGVKAPPVTRTPPPDIRGRVRGLGMRPGMRGAGLSNIEKSLVVARKVRSNGAVVLPPRGSDGGLATPDCRHLGGRRCVPPLGINRHSGIGVQCCNRHRWALLLLLLLLAGYTPGALPNSTWEAMRE